MKRHEEILFVGMGAIGTMIAYSIQAGGRARVTAVLRSNHKVVKESGYTIDSVDHGKDIQGWRPHTICSTVPDLCNNTEKWYDYVVLATKNTPDVPGLSVVDLIAPAVKPGMTAIVLAQNGLNIEAPFQERFPNNAILSGIHMMGVRETSPGILKHDEPDITKIGLFDSDYSTTEQKQHHLMQTKRFVEIYNACGKVDCQFDEDVKYTRWRKLVYNSSYNTISAILGMDVTRMRIYEHVIDNLVKPITQEIMDIAAAAGVELPEELPMQFITIDGLDSWFMPSMGQDAAKGNYMEYENIVGEPMREAQKLGVPCPTLTTVYGILKGMQTKVMETKGVIKPNIENVNKYTG